MSAEENVSNLKQHLALSKFTIYILISLSLYSYLVEVVDNRFVKGFESTFTTALLLIFLLLPCVIYIFRSKLPLGLFGFSWGNVKKNVVETLLYSFVFLCLIGVGEVAFN